ncbi:hypothetical protein ONE63_004544 [Megalurothrips usitatus]|uniref:PHD-type domain-containing protein n=1 Tax=Megalurothrips usitatus TaxID=439358 RepID=A0AAV7X3Y9_9NEOP|nr:hypothetical protein ONE63_004544 [Megalurothrips usitatus]
MGLVIFSATLVRKTCLMFSFQRETSNEMYETWSINVAMCNYDNNCPVCQLSGKPTAESGHKCAQCGIPIHAFGCSAPRQGGKEGYGGTDKLCLPCHNSHIPPKSSKAAIQNKKGQLTMDAFLQNKRKLPPPLRNPATKLFKSLLAKIDDDEMVIVLTIQQNQFGDAGGFQTPAAGLLNYDVAKRHEDTVHIIFDKEREHWATVVVPQLLREGGGPSTVFIFDSMLRAHTSNLTTSLSFKITQMCNEKGPTIHVVFPPCHQQTDKDSCGYFAIANAETFLITRKIRCIYYKTSEMRDHLSKCKLRQKFFPFLKDSTLYRSPSEMSMKEDIQVLCSCRMPQEYDSKMVKCEMCFEWYHLKCVGLTSSPGGWVCDSCTS